MRVFDNGENSENGNNSDNSENGNNGDNGFFFYAYGRTNKIYFFDSSMKSSGGMLVAVSDTQDTRPLKQNSDL